MVIGHVPDGLEKPATTTTGGVHRVQAKVTDPPRPAQGTVFEEEARGARLLTSYYVLQICHAINCCVSKITDL